MFPYKIHALFGKIHGVACLSSIIQRYQAYPRNGFQKFTSPILSAQQSKQDWLLIRANSSLGSSLDDDPSTPNVEEEPEFHSPIPVDTAEQESLLLARPSSQPKGAKISKVAIVGTPNAGKSTLINCLLGRRICAVSQKVHTTRTKALAVITHQNTQLVLLDTPGMISFSQGRRHKLPRSLLVDAKNTMLEANLLAVLVDVSNKWTNMKLDPEVLLQLHTHSHIPAVLILNKVDALEQKHSLFEITEALTEGVVDGRDINPHRKREKEADHHRLQEIRSSEEGEDIDAERTRGERMAILGTDDVEMDHENSRDVHYDELGNVGLPKERIGAGHAKNAQNHDRLIEEYAQIHAESQTESEQSHMTDHVTSERTERSGDLDPVKRDIMQQYSENLLQFVDPSDDTGSLDQDHDAVAKQRDEDRVVRREEMEREREERRRLWRIAKERSGWAGFKAVFMVSALHGDGVKDLKEYLLDGALPGDWEYHEDVVTNLSPEEILRDAIREKLLETLPQEVPYTITQSTELWEVGENGQINIVQTLICGKKSHLRMLEKKVGWIGRQATQNLMDAFHSDVKLSIYLKLK